MADLLEDSSCVEQKDSLADVITSSCLDELDYDELIEPESNASLLPVSLALDEAEEVEESPGGGEEEEVAEEGELSSDEEGEIKGITASVCSYIHVY